MPRRASSGPHPATIILTIIAIAAIGFGAMNFIKNQSTDSFENTAQLQLNDFLANGNSLRGNEYRLEGIVDEKLRWTPDRGQILSVFVEQNGSSGFVPVEVPSDFQSGNINLRQKYAFKLRFRDGGIAVASAVQAL